MALKSTERRVDELELNKQDILVSGVTIKTINGNSVLGSGNLTVGGSASWGSITGTLSSQTDLQTALDAKQDDLISGTNIKTINSTSLLGSGDITVGSGITVGTTAVTSGTDGRVFFQSGGVVQQDSAFFWDNTNKRLGIGTSSPATGTVIDANGRIKSAGLSSDYLNNTANTVTLIQFSGNGNRIFDNSGVHVVNIRSGNFGIGIGTNIPAARLDVRAQGALSTDMVQRWRNSANTADIGSIRGNGIWCIGLLASAPTGVEGAIYYDSTTKKHYGFDGTNWNALY